MRQAQSIPKRIARIKFGLISPQEYRNMSVTRVITADTYDDDGYPIEMGLMDTRLGVIDPGLRCRTCSGQAGECPGHFGHIDMIAPVIHVGFAKHIRRLLRSTCRSCSKVMLKQSAQLDVRKQIAVARSHGQSIESIVTAAYKESEKTDVCPYCGATQRKIVFEKPTSYYEEEHRLTPRDIRDRFERIPDEDIRAFGMDPENARPEWMIMTVLPVPPVTVRPSITLQSGQRSEDDFTHKLVDIIRINQRFQENKDAGAPQLILEDLWELLQYHVTTFIDNAVAGIPPARHRSGRPLKTLSQRLKGKEGRFRGSLSGKRVNFSARTVISPDPNLSIDEVGVPEAVAQEMTITEKVLPYNLDSLRNAVLHGSERHPGANYCIREDGRRVKVTWMNCEELADTIQIGWIVERQLRDGDVVLFNRQPSLHKMSIMAHKIKVMPGKTFRLNPAVCPPYNADFDGDEMNLHAPQTVEARAEAKLLLAVQNNILSPRFGGPIIGGIHDHISGSFILSRSPEKIDKNGALELLRKSKIRELSEPAGYVDDKPYWTGKQIFSHILPKGLNIEYTAEVCANCDECKKDNCDNDAYVVIKDGELLCGTIDEKSVGAFKSKLADRIIKQFGARQGRQFIDDSTRLAIRAVMRYGFSFGIDDEDIPKDARTQISFLMEGRLASDDVSAHSVIDDYIRQFEDGTLELLPGRGAEESLELKIMQVLGKTRDKAGDYSGRHLGLENSAVIMAQSGARGSMLNLAQMSACVGQQAVRGQRIQRGYDGRTLPHFKKGDKGIEAHGFVKNSYKSGLNPTEYFFHSIGGREGLVDTAVRTSQSGYLQRRMVNALQDLEVQDNGTVRETRGVIVQFKFGEDGIDPTKNDYSKPDAIHRIIKDVTGKVVD